MLIYIHFEVKLGVTLSLLSNEWFVRYTCAPLEKLKCKTLKNFMDGITNEQTNEFKDNNYIPLHINAEGIIIATKQPPTLKINPALQYLGQL